MWRFYRTTPAPVGPRPALSFHYYSGTVGGYGRLNGESYCRVVAGSHSEPNRGAAGDILFEENPFGYVVARDHKFCRGWAVSCKFTTVYDDRTRGCLPATRQRQREWQYRGLVVVSQCCGSLLAEAAVPSVTTATNPTNPSPRRWALTSTPSSSSTAETGHSSSGWPATCCASHYRRSASSGPPTGVYS